MCSFVTPSIANLFMAHLEKRWINYIENNVYSKYMIYWERYIDDVILLYKDQNSLDGFHAWINNLYPSITFSMDHHKYAISILDRLICENCKNKLPVRLHTKKPDKNSYLNFHLFHPIGLRSNIPYSQF